MPGRVLADESSSARGTYRLECALTGRVKMYKWSRTDAQALDAVLRDHGSTCRWLAGGRVPK